MKEKIIISFIGLGLIGGSVAKALKQKNSNLYLKVYDKNLDTLKKAMDDHIADEIVSTPNYDFFQCDYLFLCAPVENNIQLLTRYYDLLPSSVIITDVGSVKEPIHSAIRSLGLSSRFIGGHPMAGSERYGYSNSSAGLLENAYYILTPEKEVSQEKIEEFTTLIRSAGAIPYLLNVKMHDRATAAISHLPHLIASGLVNLVRTQDDPQETFKTLAAGGFKDLTRIASSSSTLWQQICEENRKEILSIFDLYLEQMMDLRNHLSDFSSSYLYDFFESAKIYRDSCLDVTAGALTKQYLFTVDIPDKKGALAGVVSLLSEHDVNIKNIGIRHNREEQEGALTMEFYRKKDWENAKELLTKYNYTFHLNK